MKNKFLKVLAIGAACGLGALTLTGCSVDIPDDQMNKLMNTVDSVTADFSDLTNTVQDLGQTVEDLNNQLKQKTDEEMIKIAIAANRNMILYRQEYTKNCKITCSGNGKTMANVYYYLTPDNTRVYICQNIDEVDDSVTYKVIYSLATGETYSYDSATDTKEQQDKTFESAVVMANSHIRDIFYSSFLTSEQANSLYDTYKLTEDDDYLISFVQESIRTEESYDSGITQVEFLISHLDITVKNITIKSANFDIDPESSGAYNSEQSITMGIGEVKENEISTMLSTAIAKVVS